MVEMLKVFIKASEKGRTYTEIKDYVSRNISVRRTYGLMDEALTTMLNEGTIEKFWDGCWCYR